MAKTKSEVFGDQEDSACIDSQVPSAKRLINPFSGTAAPQGLCVECEDREKQVFCEQCHDNYCKLCFQAQHRRGNRSKHSATPIVSEKIEDVEMKDRESEDSTDESKDSDSEGNNEYESLAKTRPSKVLRTSTHSSKWFLERAKHIPVRLTLQERKQLRLVEAALHVSAYTDKVDVLSSDNSKRISAQIKEVHSILLGITIAAKEGKVGKEHLKQQTFDKELLQTIFEISRRYKIMNPEKMRSDYGKLIYLLQDTMLSEIQEMLGFSCVTELRTVYSVLEEGDALQMLEDDLIFVATKEIIADNKTRPEIQREIKQKEKAIESLSQRYANSNLNSSDLKQCLYSIGDNHSFLRCNRDPCDKMIQYLTKYFSPASFEEGFSLAIISGKNGARLTHSHARQFHYVLQSLTLWREILHDMFKLWHLAEQDLLAENNNYKLTNTGQGFHRVQAAPRVSKHMHRILYETQEKLQHWVGSSVIHLGDHNVPNALMFIDKYTQVSRILNPIVLTLNQIDDLMKTNTISDYLENTFGGPDKLRKIILCDFFRSAFDGSGADNFVDAGSCIDGRLTSAWNWCSLLAEKPFFPIFLLSGFVGFDGTFL